MTQSIGACIGSSSVSLVKITKDEFGNINIDKSFSVSHNGDPKPIFESKLKEFASLDLPIVVTGRKFRKLVNLTNISEPEATEIAFEFTNKNKDKYSAIASLGGETFIVYTLDDDSKISNVVSKNQCGSGTGEFFLQQIKRMNLSLEDTVDIAKDAEPFKVSGRCSVFCKSDCTHALNKGTPKSEVISGLSLMIADKIEDLLKKNSHGKVLLVGGVTKNHTVMNFVKKKINNIEIPESADYFEALGAAIYGLNHPAKSLKDVNGIFNLSESSFTFLNPLKNYSHLVKFEKIEKSIPKPGEKCILGLDVGSTTTKAVIIGAENSNLYASVYIYTNGNPIKAARDCYQELLNQISCEINIIGLGTTGSGRQITGLHALTESVVNEIVAHATAAVHFDPEVDTIFEIGGQDAKYTYIVNKVPADYAMNEACSAGTGSFIEESAYESLGIKVTDIEPIALRGLNPPNFSDQCAAFISSDIKTALQENISKDDIVAGLVYSICMNYVNRVKGNRKIGNKIFMQGGVCYNKAIPIAMAALTNSEIIVPPEPGLMGAFGVALVIKEKIDIGLIKEENYDLNELANRDVIYKKPFICLGGSEKCDRKCTVNIIEVAGKKFPFGGACNKYYNLKTEQKFHTDEYDYVKKRQFLTFKQFAPENELPENAISVGINLSFHIHTLYPLYYNFFSKLGFKVILPDAIDEEGLEREMTSFCYPAQISLGLFQDLVKKSPDYYFMPSIFEMEVETGEYQRLDFNCTCVFVSGEPTIIKQAFKGDVDKNKIISPNLNFGNGYYNEEQNFIKIAEKLGIKDTAKVTQIFKDSVKIQIEYQNALIELGKEAMAKVESDPEQFAMMLIGRPYNTFADNANKGIPQKFASRGIYVMPYDIFEFRDQPIDDNMYWEGGKKILKAAKIVKNHPQLFSTYISNFSCGPDSMILTSYRDLMGTKPSLTLELDGHTADAGVNTRIDAAIDIIKNYRKLQSNIKDIDYSDFNPAEVKLSKEGSWYIKSDGSRIPLNDKSVKLLIPSMGDLNSEMFAAALRSLGFNCESLPPSNADIIKYGRSVASGKECLPVIILAGALLDYIENKWDGKENIAFFNVQGAGNCRLGQYPVFLRHVIKTKRLENVAQVTLMNEDGFAGFGNDFALRGIQGIMIGDVLDDVRSAILANAENPETGEDVFISEFKKLISVMESQPESIYNALEIFAENINDNVPERIPIEESKYIALLGEIFVRRDLYAHRCLTGHWQRKASF